MTIENPLLNFVMREGGWGGWVGGEYVKFNKMYK